MEIKPRPFVPASGLQLSLNSSGYKFFVGDAATPPAVTSARAAKLGGLLPTGEGFAASATLANSSRSTIPFDFNDAGAAEVKFTFSISDADGSLVWQSDTELVSAQGITPATLGKGQRWKRMVRIPLKVDGAWLKPGLYTLEATLAATPSVSAATIFEVANLPEVPTSGISGYVYAGTRASPSSALKISGGTVIITPDPILFGVSVANAAVTIEEIRLPNARYDHPAFSWAGKTDASGHFKVATPPGRFTVRATAVDVFPHATLEIQTYRGTAIVDVEQGKFSTVEIRVQRYSQPLSGISGLVLIGPVRPGQNDEQPLAGAQVTITEIPDPNVAWLVYHEPLTWTLTAGPDGKFTAGIPHGNYRITASVPVVAPPIGGPIVTPANTLPIGTGTAEVTVPGIGFTEVTIHVDSGIR